jgi:hypothetical protein
MGVRPLADGPNLFARLHKWAGRQDENFLTESLAVVVEQLLVLAPVVGTRLIGLLTRGFIGVPAGDAGSIEIQTQVEEATGKPDLEFSTPYRLVWIEVKAESELRTGQLEGYRVLLKARKTSQKRLGLLTRYPQTYSVEDARPDFEIRWYELADWIEDELTALDNAGEVAGYLGRQFLEFLRTRGMTLTQVGKYMPEGLRALANLMNMLFEAAAACKVSAKQVANRDFMGVNLDDTKYVIGIDFSEPEKLWFGTRCRIDPEAAAKLGGELTKENFIPGRCRWNNKVQLDSEEIHFFSRSKVSQMQWLEEFLQDCLSKARSIETPDQPPIPEEPEEN